MPERPKCVRFSEKEVFLNEGIREDVQSFGN